MRTLRFLLLAATLTATAGCGARSAFQHKPPPDPLVTSSKKPLVGVPTGDTPVCRTQAYPVPPPVPDMNQR